MAALLVRDLAEIVSPAGSDAPLRGLRLRDVSVTADAYVLCEEGRIVEVGSMADLPKLGRGRRGARRPRPLRDSGTRRLPYACLLRGRPGGRVRPPLGWGDLRRASCSRERHPLHRSSHARGGPRRARCRTGAPPRLDARARHHHLRGEVGLRARSGDRARNALALFAMRAGSQRGSGRMLFLPSSRMPMPTWPSRSRLYCRRQRRSRRRPMCSSSGAHSTSTRHGATSRRAAVPVSSFGCTQTSSQRPAASHSRSSSAPGASTTSRRPGRRA